MKIYRCMHDIEAMCNEHGRQLLVVWFINYLPFTKFHIVNPVWAISTLIIPVTITYVTFFLNGILVEASVSYGHFSSFITSQVQKIFLFESSFSNIKRKFIMSHHHRGRYIVFSVDPVGVIILFGVCVASCLLSVSFMNRWIIVKLTQIIIEWGENAV